ncbi:hypothetical protein GCM10022281_22330 [Sphingomonas rosea]|uniref:DUF6985 domain-containing protein n=1 Tax=Sphingomonas rosea TaxID=335605 RepID=A0ABP7UDN2_9SPHN
MGITLPALSDRQLSVTFRPGRLSLEACIRTVETLATMPVDDRSAIETALFDFYSEAIDDGDFETAQEQLDWEKAQGSKFLNPRAAAAPSEVWPLTAFDSIIVTTDRSENIIAQVEGRAAWDGEHGVVLTFSDNGELRGVAGWGKIY